MAMMTNTSVAIPSMGPAPDYTPPAFRYKDADEITIPAGRYYKAGHRLEGQYQDLVNIGAYWDLAASVDVDCDAAGTMIGGDVVSSWYSVYMTSASTFLVLPFIRVDAIAYSAPSTIINPAAHADGTSAANGFVSANDCLNSYRLMQLCGTAYHGTIHTIADSVDATPDQILITGDQTAKIAATEWLQMIPPAGTACLYLGDVGFDGSGDLIQMDKEGWAYYFARVTINGVKGTEAAVANTELGSVIPPTAKKISGWIFALEPTSCRGIVIRTYRGTTGTRQSLGIKHVSNTAQAYYFFGGPTLGLSLGAVTSLRNHFAYMDTSDVEQAITAGGTAAIYISGFEE